MEWYESVDKLEQTVKEIAAGNSPKLKLVSVLEALTGWINTEMCEYTEGAYEALGRRVVWVFPNEYTLTLGTDITLLISHVNKELEASPLPFPESMDEAMWDFNPSANGWSRKENLEFANIIEFVGNISEEVGGLPKLAVCLNWRLENASGEADYLDEDDYLGQALVKLANITEDEDMMKALQSLLPWELEIAEETDYLSYYCDYSRFERFTSFLEETGKWMVILDEHCAACASGTRKSLVSENSALKDAPQFLTWGQNSQGTYMPDGTFWAEVYVEEEEDERFLKRNARKFGIELGEWEGDKFEYEGAVTFGND